MSVVAAALSALALSILTYVNGYVSGRDDGRERGREQGRIEGVQVGAKTARRSCGCFDERAATTSDDGGRW